MDFGGDAHARCGMVDAQYAVVFSAIIHWLLPNTADAPGGTALSGIVCPGGFGSPKYSHPAESTAGGPHHEQELKQTETACGGQKDG